MEYVKAAGKALLFGFLGSFLSGCFGALSEAIFGRSVVVPIITGLVMILGSILVFIQFKKNYTDFMGASVAARAVKFEKFGEVSFLVSAFIGLLTMGMLFVLFEGRDSSLSSDKVIVIAIVLPAIISIIVSGWTIYRARQAVNEAMMRDEEEKRKKREEEARKRREFEAWQEEERKRQEEERKRQIEEQKRKREEEARRQREEEERRQIEYEQKLAAFQDELTQRTAQMLNHSSVDDIMAWIDPVVSDCIGKTHHALAMDNAPQIRCLIDLRVDTEGAAFVHDEWDRVERKYSHYDEWLVYRGGTIGEVGANISFAREQRRYTNEENDRFVFAQHAMKNLGKRDTLVLLEVLKLRIEQAVAGNLPAWASHIVSIDYFDYVPDGQRRIETSYRELLPPDEEGYDMVEALIGITFANKEYKPLRDW